MNSIILALLMTPTELDLNKLCDFVKTGAVSEEAAQEILDNDAKQTYEITIEELCYEAE